MIDKVTMRRFFLYAILITACILFPLTASALPIEKSEIKERANLYINQLNFYIYIVSKLYKNFSEFEAQIIFLKYPDDPYIIEYLKDNRMKIDREINSKIKGILEEDFSQNLSHCVKCNFSINARCII